MSFFKKTFQDRVRSLYKKLRSDQKAEARRAHDERDIPLHIRNESGVLKQIYELEARIHSIQKEIEANTDPTMHMDTLGKKIKLEEELRKKIKILHDEMENALSEANSLLKMINHEQASDYNSFKDLMELIRKKAA